MSDARQPLSGHEKLAYGLGDAAANFVFQTQITFLLFFYTDVFGITASAAGTIILVSRFIDAFTDPVFGAIADRTSSRWGRYRPWILWTAIPLGISLVLCFTTPPLEGTAKLIWVIATYNVLMFTYAANNIPYCALSGVMTADLAERTSLSSWRFVCAMAAAFVVNTFTLRLVEQLGSGNDRIGYPYTMALWAALAVVFFTLTFAFTRERVQPDPQQGSSIWQDLSDLGRNGPWIALFLLAVLIHVQLGMRGGALLYYFNYCLQLPRVFSWIDNFGLFNGVGLIFTIVGVAMATPLATRYGKRATFRACLFLSAILLAAFALVPSNAFYTLFGLQVLLQLAFGPTIPILWSMMADVADYSEWMNGRRSTALAFASIIFGLKLGLGVGAWLNGQLLESIRYSPTTSLSVQTKFGIVSMVSIFPAAILILGVGALFIYRLDDALMNDIESGLIARRTGQNLPS
jgi:sugar (glycoside-pentoside-hexuronide) transporter